MKQETIIEAIKENIEELRELFEDKTSIPGLNFSEEESLINNIEILLNQLSE